MKNTIIMLLMAAIALTGCQRNNSKADAWGNFEARETIISAQSGGKILALHLEKGQWIDEGAIAGIIDTIPYVLAHRRLMAQRESISSRLLEADAQIDVFKEQMTNLDREINRTRRLVDDFAATRQQLDDLTGKYNVLEKQVSAAALSKNHLLAELQAMDAQLDLASEQLAYCSMINPINGIVLEKYAEPFEITAPGKPIYKVADLSVMDLKVFVSGSQLANLSLGQKVNVFVDDEKNSLRQLEGTINWISPRAEFTPKTIQTKEERINQVYAVKISVKNPDGKLKIGMPGEVVFHHSQQQ
jgi:HlyD family secretion protein